MGLVIEHAWWLAGAAVLLLTVAGLWILQRQRSARWRIACVGLPGAAVILISLALARPEFVWSPPAKRVVLLLDLSGSTRQSPWRDPQWVEELAQRRLREGTQLTVVGFGGAAAPRVLLENAPLGTAADGRWPAHWENPAAEEMAAGSNLAAAMRWRSNAEARGEIALAPRWVITDGLTSGGGGRGQEIAALKNAGAEIAWTAVPPPEVDVGVIELSVHVVTSVPEVEVWARLAATDQATAIMQITCNGRVLARQQLSFSQAGTRWVSVRDPQAPVDSEPPRRYEVSLSRLPFADPWPENDHASVLWSPQLAPGRVLVIGSAQGAEPLAIFQRRFVPPSQFPSDIGTLLAQGWQVIVLNDLPLALDEDAIGAQGASAQVLPPSIGRLLDRFVRQTGGGVVILGHGHAFGPGHYPDGGAGPATLEGLSPVFSSQHDRPPARIVFVLDASGSMNESAGAHMPEQKFRLAARGVEEAMDLLLDDDQVTLITFNDRATQIALGTKARLMSNAGAATLMRARLDLVRPTGNTAPDSALQDIAQALGSQIPPSPLKPLRMVVLLTDGEIPQIDQARWKSALEHSGARLTIVAPPPADPQKSALQQLAKQVAAAWLPADDAGQWAALLKRAIARQISGSAVAEPIPWQSTATAGSALRGTAPEFIQVWKKPESQELASGEREGTRWTLGAVAQRGLGKVAALAFAESDPAYAQLLERVVRDVMPAPGDRRFTLTEQRDQDSWRITADGADGPAFLDGQRLLLRILGTGDPSQPARDLPMPQVGPGRYECRVANADNLLAIVVREQPTGDELVGRINSARVALDEWPASFQGAPALSPPGTTMLPADASVASLWQPHLHRLRVPLEKCFWTLAALFALGALWLRRGPIGSRGRA